MSELIHFIYFGTAVSFVIMSFKRSRVRAVWARSIFFTISGLFMIMAVCGLAVDLHYWNLSKHDLSQLEYHLQAIRGFVLGCAFVLLVSGELVGKKVLKDEAVA